jgi:hypothetical protein
VAQALWVATRKGLFRLAADEGWQVRGPAFVGDPVTNVLHDARDGTVYATLNLGHFGVKLQRSSDGGAHWEEVAAPSYAGVEADPTPPPPAEGAPADPAAVPKPPSLELLWTLEAGGADQPGRLWAGTIPGGLFRSDDRGQSWSLVRSLWEREERRQWFGGGYDRPGIHSVVVDPRDTRRLHVAVSCGGAWVSDDDGATWTCRSDGMEADYMPPERRLDPVIQDPHRVAACASAPDVLWAQHHCGIFRTTDGGTRWTRLHAQPSSFGFAVAAHPTDPERAWFVPAVKDERRVPVDGRLVVTRTDDGGRTFRAFDRGLPQPSFDLVYRHGLDVDGTGERLAMGSTTGGLWLSEDAGESWRCLSAHLPPVYAVRWGA